MKNLYKIAILVLLSSLSFSDEISTITYFGKTYELCDCEIMDNDNQICIKKEFYDDGSPLWEQSWNESYRMGLWTKYYKNGRKWYEGHYQSGQKVDDWTEWYQNGRVKQIETYIDITDSYMKKFSYYKNGKIESEQNYFFYQGGGDRRMDKHGKWIYYNQDGTTKKEESWENGELITTKSFSKEEDIMNKNEPKVVGIGGVFFKSDNPEETKKWYQENLGFETDQWGTMFKSRDIDNPDEVTYLQWSPFNTETDYFDPSKKEFMINYRVQNIEDFVKVLKEKGVTVLDEITEYGEIGKFVHILDPQGNKIELWEPLKPSK